MRCIINQVFELILAYNIACHFLQLTEACLNCPEYFRRLVNKTADGLAFALDGTDRKAPQCPGEESTPLSQC